MRDKKIKESDIDSSFMKGLISAFKKNPFIDKLDYLEIDGCYAVEFDARVEIPQHPIFPINPIERLLLVEGVEKSKRNFWLCALRQDFPDTPHQNLVYEGQPKQLCLFEQPFYELAAYITPEMIAKKILDWLARAACSNLHLPNQPFEPLVFSDGYLIYDHSIKDGCVNRLDIYQIPKSPNVFICINEEIREEHSYSPPSSGFVLFPFEMCIDSDNIIHKKPTTLLDLEKLLLSFNLDLSQKIKEIIEFVETSGEKIIYDKKIILLIKIEKSKGPEIEHEFKVFVIYSELKEIGACYGLIDSQDGFVVKLIGQGVKNEEPLTKILVHTLTPIPLLNRQLAQFYSGIQVENVQITMIGAGALGSQLAMNLVRQGFGTWLVIDEDFLLPHNFIRHSLNPTYVGRTKAESLANEMCLILNDGSVAKGFSGSYLYEDVSENEEYIQNSDVIIDASTSPAVTSELARKYKSSTIVLTYLSPDGKHIIYIQCGNFNTVRIDDMHQQLLMHLMISEDNRNVLSTKGEQHFITGSCRDVTTLIPNDNLMIAAGLVSKQIKAIDRSKDKIIVWKSDLDGVKKTEFPVFAVHTREFINDWEIRLSNEAKSNMQRLRFEHKPNETGGILLGRIDFQYKTIFIPGVLGPPPDSIEYPCSFIRGSKSLEKLIKEISRNSNGELTYVGEWHTHPNSSIPSPSDKKALDIIFEELQSDGLPAMMLVIGEDEITALFRFNDHIEEIRL